MTLSSNFLSRFSRFCFLFTGIWILVLLTGCTSGWVSEATQIIQLLVPAISSILGILSAFGAGLAPDTMSKIQSWANQATTGLQTVAGLIDQYNAAEATAKPGILTEIQTALSTITQNLSAILPEIHVTDAGTQAKIQSIINLVASEMQALINLVPALKGQVTSHDELKTLMNAVKSPQQFREEFNNAVASFGTQYQI